MARKPLRPLIRSGGFYPSRKWTPLVYAGGYTTANGGGEPEPPPIEKTITGNPIHILDALAKPAQALSVKLEPIQDLHGYDNPWASGAGKNIAYLEQGSLRFDNDGSETASNTRVRTGFIPVELSVYYVASSQNNGWVIKNGCAYDSEKNYLGYGTVYPEPLNGLFNTDTITAPWAQNIKYVRFIYGNADNTNCTPSDYWYQFEKGTTPTTFAPYSNLCPISGHTYADVTRTGVNMADPSVFDCTEPSYSTAVYWLGMTANADGTFTLTRPVGWGGTGFVYIGTYKAGMYEVSFDLIDDANVVCGAVFVAKRIGTWTTVASADWSGTLTEVGRAYKSITLPEDAEIWCAVGPWADNGASVISGNYQVSLTAAHDYVPYNGTTYHIPLGQTVYGGTLDVLTGVLTVTHGCYTFAGTEVWSTNASNVGRYFSNDFLVRGSAKLPSDNWHSVPIRTTIGLFNIAYFDMTNTHWKMCIAADGRVGINTDLHDSYSENNVLKDVQLVYELATPITIQLTPTQVELLLGENNIWSDGEMTLVYLADGNASDEEALNILLGGRYLNTHGADEPSDREALDIVLGGKK